MAIYLQSRGIHQNQDYCWLKVAENSQTPEIPLILRRPISVARESTVYITDIIDSQTPSMVLARLHGELLLLVTGLEARAERTDFMGRRVRNSVVWVYPDNHDYERVTRSLAIRALKGELETEIDKAVNLGGEYGFEISFVAISQLAKPEEVKNQAADLQVRIGRNSLVLRESLALELEQNQLPQKDGLLIVVTSTKTQSALIQVSVWRGLSNRLKNDEWQSFPLVADPANISHISLGQQLEQKKSLWRITILILGVLILVLIVLLFVKLVIPQVSPPETNTLSTPHQTNLQLEKMPQKTRLAN